MIEVESFASQSSLDSAGVSPREAKCPTVVIEARPRWRLLDWREFMEYRDLLYFLVLRDFTVLYKQTVLGISWAILNPFFNMVVFTIIFGRMLKVESDGRPYAIFTFTALLPWTYFSQALTGATNSLISGTNIFTKVYFPRLFIPLVPVFSKLVDFAIAFLILLGMMAFYRIAPTWRVLMLPIPIVLMMLSAAGLGIWFSALAIQYRDVRHAMTFAVQILMYAAPVVWPVSKIPDAYRMLYGIYPMAGVIEAFRSCLLGTASMPWDLLMTGTLSGLGILLIGGWYFRSTERFFADVA